MRNKVVIIGNSHFSEVVFEHIVQDTEWFVEAFAVDSAYIDRHYICEKKVVAIEELDRKFDAKETSLVLAVGYGNGNKTRKKLYSECVDKGFSFINYIHSSAKCSQKVSLGNGNIVFPGTTIDSFVSIGDGNIILPQVMVGHDVTIGDFCAISGGSLLGGSAKIGDMVFLGMGSIIKDQVSVSSEAYIGASCYIHKNVKGGQCILPTKAKYMNERESCMFKEIYQ